MSCVPCKLALVILPGIFILISLAVIVKSGALIGRNTPMASPGTTVSWLIQSDRKTGIEFKYPRDWRIDQGAIQTVLYDKNNQKIITIEPGVSLDVLNQQGCAANRTNSACEIAEFNGSVFEINWSAFGKSISAFVRESATTGIRFTLNAKDESSKKTFRELLSTFNFGNN